MAWDLKEPECLSRARLIIAAPEFVYEQMRFYGENVGLWDEKKDLEKLLLQRNDKLVNLALAQFATDKSVVQQLYDQASEADLDQDTYNLGVRVACLSNRNLDYFSWPDFDLGRLIPRGLTPESRALLTNPSVPDSVLEALFRKTDCFASVDEKNWLWMIQRGAENERLNTDKSSRDDPDLGLWRIHKAVFAFLENAPLTSHAAFAVIDVLVRLNPRHTTWPDEIAHVLERWAKVELKDHKGEEYEGWSTRLSLKQELLCLIAALYSRRSPTDKSGPPVFGSPDDEDVALRCAFYAGSDLSEKQIEAGFAKDQDVFLLAVLKNTSVLLNPKKRALIEAELFGVFVHEYQRRCEDIRKRFKHFDTDPVSDGGRDLLEESQQQGSKEISWLEKISAQNERLLSRLQHYEHQVYWIVLLLIGAMYFLAKR